MPGISLFLIGLLVGILVTWVLLRTSFMTQLAEVQARARAAEQLRDELRQQTDRKDKELSETRMRAEQERQIATEAQTRLQAAQQNLDEQKRLLEEAAVRLADTFKALSADALRTNNQEFLTLAKQSLEAVLGEAKSDISRRQEAIGTLVQPLQETLKRYEEQVNTLEQRRQSAYGSLEQQLKSLGETQQLLQRETTNLVTALRSPHVRGRWGEMTLRRAVELAGLSEHCDFVEQTTVQADSGRLRPDMIIRLPGGRTVVVDAKVSLDAYLNALDATTDEQRNAELQQHARQLRSHMDHLASKSYWNELSESADFVVMFVPGESFFSAAVTVDRSLIEDAVSKKVVLATPTTLIALLRAIAYGWRQAKMEESARQIGELGKELYERLVTLTDHFNDLGKSLDRAVDSYNKAVGSMESRVLISARHFKEMGTVTGQEIPVLEPVDHTVRSLNPPKPSKRSGDAA